MLNTLECFQPRSILISSFGTDGSLHPSGSFGVLVETPDNATHQSLWDHTPAADAIRLSQPLHFASAQELHRQQEVLNYMSQGATNAQIAKRLGFSESTIKQETMAIYRHFGVRSRAEAVRASQDR